MVLFYSDQQRAKGVKVKMYTLDLMGESLAQLTLYSQQKKKLLFTMFTFICFIISSREWDYPRTTMQITLM